MIKVKKCSACKIKKPVTEYHKTKSSKDGYKTNCKLCRSIYAKKKRVENGGSNRIDRSTETEELQICTKCLKLKDRLEFTNGTWCLICRREYHRNHYGYKEKFVPKITSSHKECVECKTMVKLVNFSSSKRGRLGLSSYCKPCTSKRRLSSTTKKQRREQVQKYRDNNRNWWRSKHRIHQFNRRRKQKLVSDGTVTKDFIESIYKMTNCYYCKEEIPKDLRTLEHILPLNRGGLHTSTNITMACLKCNTSKRDMTEKEFKNFNNKKQ